MWVYHVTVTIADPTNSNSGDDNNSSKSSSSGSSGSSGSSDGSSDGSGDGSSEGSGDGGGLNFLGVYSALLFGFWSNLVSSLLYVLQMKTFFCCCLTLGVVVLLFSLSRNVENSVLYLKEKQIKNINYRYDQLTRVSDDVFWVIIVSD